MATKKDAAAAAAMAALGVGTREQGRRMQPQAEQPPRAARKQLAVQFTEEGLALLNQAQARLLARQVRRAGMPGVALEVVLKEWLEAAV